MLTQTLQKIKPLPADAELDLRMYGKYLAFLRRHPIHAVRLLWGIVIPPHESMMLKTAWMGYRTSIFVCSRGTSKTFTIGSLFAPTKSLLYKSTSTLIASASRFRGGKVVLKDSSRLVRGSLKNQKQNNNWGYGALSHKPSLIKKDPDMWYMEFNSNSMVYTIPTNNEESVRGLRANILVLDERNTFDGDIIKKVYLPFLNVGTDFENPAAGSEGNQVFYVGTIDYTYRDWYKDIASVSDLAKIQYELQMARKSGNWRYYDELLTTQGKRIKNASFALTRYDYTDLLIPTKIGAYKINYPGAVRGKHIKWDERDQTDYIYTYPVEKKQLEDPLDEGTMDKEMWEAEQRNMFIRADGNVFPAELVEKVYGPIYTETEEKKRGWDSEDMGRRSLPPVLYNSGDPCILGIDTARVSDFTAFVVIRMGNAPEQLFKNFRKDYSIIEGRGPSPFANVIWAEQHQQMTTKETTNKIRELCDRYNIVATRNCPGIVIDYRGGGTNVRDELVNPSPEVDPDTGLALDGWTPPRRIFDPEDKDERLGKDLLADPNAWFALRLLATNDIINNELVGFAKAQMQSTQLYIGNSASVRGPRDVNSNIYYGTVGVDVLKHQLLRIQAIPTPSGKSIQYVMPGDPKKVESKKDMLMAFLYACHALREWINNQSSVYMTIPIAYGEAFIIGR